MAEVSGKRLHPTHITVVAGTAIVARHRQLAATYITSKSCVYATHIPLLPPHTPYVLALPPIHLCPFGPPAQPDAYLRALRGGDLATLDLLAALGCPWRPNEQRHAPNDQRPTANVFGLARKWRCGVPVMRWLAAAGCPMDFRRLAKEARLRGDTDMAAWAEGELQRQQQQKEQKEQELVKVAEESGREGQAGAGAGAVAGAGLGLQVVGRAV